MSYEFCVHLRAAQTFARSFTFARNYSKDAVGVELFFSIDSSSLYDINWTLYGRSIKTQLDFLKTKQFRWDFFFLEFCTRSHGRIDRKDSVPRILVFALSVGGRVSQTVYAIKTKGKRRYFSTAPKIWCCIEKFEQSKGNIALNLCFFVVYCRHLRVFLLLNNFASRGRLFIIDICIEIANTFFHIAITFQRDY